MWVFSLFLEGFFSCRPLGHKVRFKKEIILTTIQEQEQEQENSPDYTTTTT